MITLLGKCLKEVAVKSGTAFWQISNVDGTVRVEWSGLIVSICGGAEVAQGRSVWEEAVEMTRLITHQGGIVINGGGASGIMLASAMSFPQSTIGIVTSEKRANSFGPKVVVDDYLLQAAILTKMPQVVVFEGGVGTMDKWTRVLNEIKVSLSSSAVPPKLYLHEYWRPVFNSLWEIRSIPKKIMDQVQFFTRGKDVLETILNS